MNEKTFNKIFVINSIKKDNYENVSRLFCTSEDLKLTIDVHNIFLENEPKKFSLEIIKDINKSINNTDYIMNCVVLNDENDDIVLSCYGLLVNIEQINKNKDIYLKNKEHLNLKLDEHITLLLNIID